jgi:hypothetical protein
LRFQSSMSLSEDPSPGGVAQLVERVLYHSTRRAVPERSWVQSLLPSTEVEPGFSTFGGMLVPVLQLISPVCARLVHPCMSLSEERELEEDKSRGMLLFRSKRDLLDTSDNLHRRLLLILRLSLIRPSVADCEILVDENSDKICTYNRHEYVRRMLVNG